MLERLLERGQGAAEPGGLSWARWEGKSRQNEGALLGDTPSGVRQFSLWNKEAGLWASLYCGGRNWLPVFGNLASTYSDAFLLGLPFF